MRSRPSFSAARGRFVEDCVEMLPVNYQMKRPYRLDAACINWVGTGKAFFFHKISLKMKSLKGRSTAPKKSKAHGISQTPSQPEGNRKEGTERRSHSARESAVPEILQILPIIFQKEFHSVPEC